MDFDSVDKEIINILQDDASISNIELSKKIGLSPSACLSRTKHLKELGVIKQYVTIVNEKMIGLEIVAFTFVNLSPHNRSIANAFLSKVKETPQILECYNITGNWDYLLKIVAHDINSYRNFIMDILLEFPGVHKIDSSIVLGTDKQSFNLPLDQI
ncbi:MAG: Lrp/AsnC family transcriptional regulator [Bacillota bacterium]